MKKTLLVLLVLVATLISSGSFAKTDINGLSIGFGLEYRTLGNTYNNNDNSYSGIPGTENGYKYSNELIDSVYNTPSIKVGYIFQIENDFLFTPEIQFNLGDSETSVYKLKVGYLFGDYIAFNLGIGAERSKVVLNEGIAFNGYETRFIVEPEVLYIVSNNAFINVSLRFGEQVKSLYTNTSGEQAKVNYNITSINIGYNIVFDSFIK